MKAVSPLLQQVGNISSSRHLDFLYLGYQAGVCPRKPLSAFYPASWGLGTTTLIFLQILNRRSDHSGSFDLQWLGSLFTTTSSEPSITTIGIVIGCAIILPGTSHGPAFVQSVVSKHAPMTSIGWLDKAIVSAVLYLYDDHN